jgi:putative ABC transport system permease protein
LTGQELIDENQDDVEQVLTIFNTILSAFAYIALVVSLFIIYNTFSIVVAQRVREMALLRAIGASTRQVRSSIIVESLVIGLIAGLVGFVAGIGLAVVIKTLLELLDLDIPASGLTIPPGALVTAVIVAVVATVVSAFIPARRASRVPPVAAMRDVAFETKRGFLLRGIVGTIMSISGFALVLYTAFELPDDALQMLGLGAGAIFVGVIVVGPVIARPIARILGSPLPLFKHMTGTLARENAVRNPRRTAATASALMIGVALVGFITIFAASTKASIKARPTTSSADSPDSGRRPRCRPRWPMKLPRSPS